MNTILRMKYNLFLDDIRDVPIVYPHLTNNDFVIVRNYSDFVDYIKKNGRPKFISFDNDLGLDESGEIALDGFAAAKWLVFESGLNLIDLKFEVHSSNPVAKVQISSLLSNYIEFLHSKENG